MMPAAHASHADKAMDQLGVGALLARRAVSKTPLIQATQQSAQEHGLSS
jgi:hypothetical protein